MLHIKIRVFKNTGKFYSDSEVKQEEDIQLFEDRFKQLVKDNLSATISDGYVVVTDLDDGDGFHIALYRMGDLM